MAVLVTGGAGFIGAHVCAQLGRPGRARRVVVLDDLSTGLTSNLAGLDHVELVVGSVLDDERVTDLMARVDAVVHLAAVPAVARSLDDPRTSYEVNATGTVTVLEAARRHGCHAIVASSSSVYGPGAELPAREDQPTRPASPYAASKLAAEAWTLAYGRSFELPVLAFRFFNVFGPLQRADHAYAAVIPAFIDAARAGRPLTVHGDGTQTRDFTYVGDVAAVVADAVDRRVTSEFPVNLAFRSRHLAPGADLGHRGAARTTRGPGPGPLPGGRRPRLAGRSDPAHQPFPVGAPDGAQGGSAGHHGLVRLARPPGSGGRRGRTGILSGLTRSPR